MEEEEKKYSLQWYERVINQLNSVSDQAIKRYNTIIKNRFNHPVVRDVIFAAGGNALLNASSAAATSGATVATTASTAIGISGPTVAALPGPVATAATGASSSSPALIPIVLAAVGGLMFGKGIGELGITLWDALVVGKGELEDLEEDVKKLKKYCDNMTAALDTAIKDLSKVSTKLSTSLDKLKDQEYKTKKSNVKRIKARASEIDTIIANTDTLIKVINGTKANLSKVG